MMQDSFEVGTNQYQVKPVAYEEFEKKIRPFDEQAGKEQSALDCRAGFWRISDSSDQ